MRNAVSTALLIITGLGSAQWATAQEQERKSYDSPWDLISAEHDKNRDGRVTKREYGRGKERFARLDTDQDGVLTALDFGSSGKAAGRRSRSNKRHERRLSRAREAMAPKVGAVAPNFTLRTTDGKQKHRLSSFKGKRPVALIFGSYT